MTKKEAAIVSAYTGILVGEFSNIHKYIEEKLKRPVFTHEMGTKKIWNEIKNITKIDFINIRVED